MIRLKVLQLSVKFITVRIRDLENTLICFNFIISVQKLTNYYKYRCTDLSKIVAVQISIN